MQQTEAPYGSLEWIREQKRKAAALAAELVRGEFRLIDVETTGFHWSDEIISIAIINQHGDVLVDTLIAPGKPILNAPRHGITDEMVAAAPTFPQAYSAIHEALDGKRLLAYNATFDLRMLDQDCDRHGLARVVPLAYECVMELYAQWWGDWNDYQESFRWQKLTTACQRFGIDPGVEHNAKDDALAALAVLKAMGEWKGE